MVHDRRVSDAELTLGVSGKLVDGNLVMYDSETDTLWQQSTGQGLDGRLGGPRVLAQRLAEYCQLTVTTVSSARVGARAAGPRCHGVSAPAIHLDTHPFEKVHPALQRARGDYTDAEPGPPGGRDMRSPFASLPAEPERRWA